MNDASKASVSSAEPDHIGVFGAQVNDLKNVNIDIHPQTNVIVPRPTLMRRDMFRPHLYEKR